MKLIFHEVQIKFIILPSLLGILIGYLFAHNFILRKELQISNQHKNEFLSKISHEIRTPLNGIIGFTEILTYLKNKVVTDKDYECILHIKESSMHLLDLVNELLDLSRIESGKIKFFITDIDLKELIHESVFSIQYLLETNNIKLHFVPKNEAVIVSADRMRLKQVFINLLSNAVKYNKTNGEIIVSCDIITENHTVVVSIKDTGMGIPAINQENIFEPFHRLEMHKDIEGSGIGLSLSKRLMNSMKGDITFESKCEEGATFHIILPMKEEGRVLQT
ncbi:MAG: HAMP domain-containing histidine kinase [Spirochaetia bacterium]|nr:HAMP domain-containing histidine kinase [Spirochaetia bacterium]